jgi:hypothetical protein
MVRHLFAFLLIASSTMPALAFGGPTAAEQAACADDQAKFCAAIKPGGGRILVCLAGHKAELADACRKVLEAHGK